MSHLSRRDLLRGTAVSAAVVPALSLRGRGVLAAGSPSAQSDSAPDADDVGLDLSAYSADGPVMVFVRDASAGDVAILHGHNETIVRDRRLVSKIVRAGSGAKAQ